MSKRRYVKAGRAFWATMQRSPRHQRYTSKKMEISVQSVAMPENILQAAQAAAEAIHASVQIVPKSEDNSVAPEQEGGAQLSVPVQSEAREETEEGSEVGAEVCGGCGVEGCKGDCDCYDDCEYGEYDDQGEAADDI